MKNRKSLHSPRTIKRPPVRKVSPLRVDPSRTGGVRRRMIADLRRRYRALQKAILDILITKDALGLMDAVPGPPAGLGGVTSVVNKDWKYEDNPNKVKRFRAWVRQQIESTAAGDKVIQEYIDEVYIRGAGRAFDDLRRGKEPVDGTVPNEDTDKRRREDHIRRMQGSKPTVEKVKLLAGRTFSELEDVNTQMASRMSRLLADGLARGRRPEHIARDIAAQTNIAMSRAQTIVRTELIRAHAEGQLDAMQAMGEESVTAQVEFASADDDRVCQKCQMLEGRVYLIDEARGIIPVHPNCRCAWVPLKPPKKQRKSR